MTMPDQNNASAWSRFRGTYYTVAVAAAVLLLLLWLMGYGPGEASCPAPAGSGSAAAAGAASPPAGSATSNNSSGTQSASEATAKATGQEGAQATAKPAKAADAAPAEPAKTAAEGASAQAPAANKATADKAVADKSVPDMAPTSVAASSADDPSRRVTFYFGSDKAELAADAPKNVSALVNYLKANPQAKVKLSGFHDASGPADHNLRLAQARARSVRALLVASGVAAERIVTPMPQATLGSGPPEQARRVELLAE